MKRFSPQNIVIIAKSQSFIKFITLVEFVQRMVFLLREEVRSSVRHSISKTLWLWKHGFLSHSCIFYSLNKTNVTQYVSDFSRYVKTPLINQEYAFVLNNKLIFSKMLQNYHTYLIPIYCLVQQGGILPIDGNISFRTPESIIELCKQKKQLVIKPTSGALGEKVHFFRVESEQCFLDNSPLSSAEFLRFLLGLDDYIISDYIQQHEYAAAIFRYSTNTLRILTMWDYEQDMPFIAMAMHRFGRTSTIPIDNWSQGGISCAVNLETGTLGQGATYAGGTELQWHDIHPDTGAQITGISIPHWKAVVSTLLDIAKQLAFILYRMGCRDYGNRI